MDRFGRKLSMAFMFVLACVFLLPLIFHQHATLTTALLFGARMCAIGTFTVASIYAPEVSRGILNFFFEDLLFKAVVDCLKMYFCFF